MAGVAGLVSAGVGLFGALSSDSPASSVQLPQMWQMPNMSGAAQGAYSGIQNLPGQNTGQQFAPQFEQIAMQLANNPYARMFQQGANTVAPYGQQAGMNSFGAGQQFQSAGTSMLPYATSIMDTAFDPQDALRGQLEQRLTDQTRAGQAARGVATTPYGAAGESDALRKFGIDWQNAQLGRQVQGAGAAGDLVSNALRTSAGGGALSDSGVGSYLNASGIPYSTFNTIGQGQLGALSGGQQGVAGGQQLALNPVQAYLQYLGVGNQAGGVANNTAKLGLDQANLGFNQDQTLGGQLGASIGGFGNAFNKTTGTTPSSNWNWLSSFGKAA